MTLVGHDPTNSALRGRQLYQFVHRAMWYSQGDSNPCLRRERPTTWPSCPWEHTSGQFIEWCPALSLFRVVSDMRLELIRLETEHFECSVSAIPPIRDIKHNLHWASLAHTCFPEHIPPSVMLWYCLSYFHNNICLVLFLLLWVSNLVAFPHRASIYRNTENLNRWHGCVRLDLNQRS